MRLDSIGHELDEMGKEVYAELNQQLTEFQKFNFCKNCMIYNIFIFNII